MRILLTTLNARFSHSSLALRYLRSFCQEKFYDIQMEEYTINDQINYILGEIYLRKAELVAFSCYIWNIDKILEIGSKLKKISPATILVLGGPEVSFEVAELMRLHPYIDYIVFGEGEQTFSELLLNLYQSRSETIVGPGILGLAYRVDGQVVMNSERPLLGDLDQIPSPYLLSDPVELKNHVVYYESSRGCPYNCQYCLSSVQTGVRYFSLERVKADLICLINNGIEHIKFVDRTFNCHRERAREIFRFLLEHIPNKQQISYHFEMGASLIDEATLKLIEIVPPGLFEFEIGVQSTNLETLASVERKADWSLLKPVVQRISKLQNIHIHLDLIAGLPKESYSSFRRSFNDVFSLRPHLLQLGFLKLLKGSGLRKQAASFGCVYSDHPPYEVLSTGVMDYEQLLRLHSIEDLVEKYYNSHRFQNCIELLLFVGAGTPFDFFEFMALFWEDQGLHRRPHSANALFQILGSFVEQNESKFRINSRVFMEVLKFDYLLQSGGVQPSAWFSRSFLNNQKQRTHDFLSSQKNIMKLLPHFQGCSAREINKFVHVEIFELDIVGLTNWLQSNQGLDLGAVSLEARTLPDSILHPSAVLFDNSAREGILHQPNYYRIDL